jgi:hypothetical protein
MKMLQKGAIEAFLPRIGEKVKPSAGNWLHLSLGFA